jgi:hypothetical protein
MADGAPTASAAPHPPQNASAASFAKPHPEQVSKSAVPHCAQKRRPSRFSTWHCPHLIRATAPPSPNVR